MNPHRSVRSSARDRAARRRLVWLLLRGDDLAGEALWNERPARPGEPLAAGDAPGRPPEDASGRTT